MKRRIIRDKKGRIIGIPEGEEAKTTTVSVRVPEYIYQLLQSYSDRSELMRNAIIEAVHERENQSQCSQ